MTIAAILGGKGSDVVTIGGDATVRDAVALLAEKRIGAVPVVEGDRVVGIFSERDVIHWLGRAGPSALDQPVRSGMTAPAISVTRDQSVLAALSLMTQRRIRHLPVIADGHLIGFVSIGDLVKYRIEKIEAEADQMRAYIQMA